jgi:adenosine kinase
MPALICGSFAYDNIMVFQGHFRDHILPDKIHILNVSFLVPDMRREFGGCAGNIAFNLNMLGGEAVPMGTVGTDFLPYQHWLEERGIPTQHVTEVPGTLTAQAFITTDLDDNQITAFHPGAMSFAQLNKIASAPEATLGIISPDGRDGMIEHAHQFAEAGIPFIFDPGQGMPMFDGEDLKRFIGQATWVAVNDYEWQLMQERTGFTPQDVAKQVKALIVTRGAEGSRVHVGDKTIEIPTARPNEIKDPTGCGDAYRAGLLYGLMREWDWEVTGRVAALMGAIKIETAGTQNHSFTLDEFKARYKENFGTSMPD